MFCNIAFYVPRQPRGSRARALRWTAACFGTRRRLEAAFERLISLTSRDRKRLIKMGDKTEAPDVNDHAPDFERRARDSSNRGSGAADQVKDVHQAPAFPGQYTAS